MARDEKQRADLKGRERKVRRWRRLSGWLGAIGLALGSIMMVGVAGAGASQAAERPTAGQHSQKRLDVDGYDYQLFIPRDLPDAATEPRTAWPLMIFLHGSGERGSDIAKVKVHGPPKYADAHPDFPFILISPLLPAEEDWDIPKLERILKDALARLPVDPDRVYLTGLSRGGHATWRWGATAPGRFAAIAPVAGRGDPATACALKNTPVWAFHGDRDDVVPPEGSFAMARAIRACGGRISRLTIYPDLGHNAWDPAYDDPSLYFWLLSQRRPHDAGR